MQKTHYKTIADEIYKKKDFISLLNGPKDIRKLFDLPSSLSPERTSLYKKLYKGIGNTPCYTVHLPNDNLLRIKMEYLNYLGNNHYSRCWLPYLFIAESLKVIKPGDTHLLEVTSGSAGISLAMAAQLLGYKLTLIIPEMLPRGRTEPMQHFGAELVRVSGYIDKCIEVLRRMLATNGYFPCNHSEEKADILVKVDKRIAIEYCVEYGAPDYCIIGLGNGTSTLAFFEYLKHILSGTKRITYHPDLEEEDVVFGLYGPNVTLRHVDPALDLTDEKIITTGIDLNGVLDHFKFDTEISNLGPSSLYAINIAMEKAKEVSGKTFMTVGYDKKDRYN